MVEDAALAATKGATAMQPKCPHLEQRSNDSHPLTAKRPAKFCSLFLWPSSNTRTRRPIDFHIATHVNIHGVLALLPSNEIVLTEPRSLVEGSRG
jgi:hypothetical protein